MYFGTTTPVGRAARSSRWGRRAAAAIAASAVIVGAAPVSAAVLERDSYHDVGSEPVDWCDGIDATHTWDVRGTVLGVARGRDGLVRYQDSSRGTNVFTNNVTHKTITARWATNSRDLQVTDNGDDTLTILVQASGGERWYDSNDKLVLREPGLVRYEILIHNGGTPTDPSDDEFLDFLGIVKGSTGRNDTSGRDFCDDLRSFTA